MKQILWGRRAWGWGVTSQSVHTRAWDERYCLQDERLLHCPPWLHRCLRGHVSHSQSRHQEMQTICPDMHDNSLFYLSFIIIFSIYLFTWLSVTKPGKFLHRHLLITSNFFMLRISRVKMKDWRPSNISWQSLELITPLSQSWARSSPWSGGTQQRSEQSPRWARWRSVTP